MTKLPGWYKGRMRTCAICGFWYGELDPKIYQKDGKWICEDCDDSLTEEERAERRIQ